MNEKRMSLFEHLTELRTRLFRATVIVMAGFFIAYGFHQELFDWISAPVREALAERGIYKLQALHVTESVFVYLKVSLVTGLFAAIPAVFYEIWAFVAPGLLPHERKYVFPLTIFSSLFFLLGVAFAYYVLLPFITGFLADLTMTSGNIQLAVTVENIYAFSTLSMILFGIVFELPILMFFMSILGLASWREFTRFFRYFILIAFIVGAMFTPPEPVSQTLMALPMIALYGLGILIAFFVGEREIREDGTRAAIGNRLWISVALCAVLFGGATYGVIEVLKPGPTLAGLIPGDVQIVVGMQPVQVDTLGIRSALATPLPKSQAAFVEKALNAEGVRHAVYFETSEGYSAVIIALAEESADEAIDPAMNALPQEQIRRIAGRQIEFMVIGSPEAVATLDRCHSDETTCLAARPHQGHQIEALLTSGPAWIHAPGDSQRWTAFLPPGALAATSTYTSAYLEIDDMLSVRAALKLPSEAAARAHHTRIDIWRETRERDAESASRITSHANELQGLISALDAIVRSSQALLAASEAGEPKTTAGPDLREARQQAHAQLQVAHQQLGSLRETHSNDAGEAPESPALTGTLIDLLSPTELGDWSFATDESSVNFVFKMSSAGLRSLTLDASRL